MSSLPTLTPEDARAFLQEAMATSRKVQVAFASLRSGTHVIIRGMIEEAPDRIGFVVRDGKRALVTIDPTQADVCRQADAVAAHGDSMAERFFPTLEFTSALILGFKEVERIAVFVIAYDNAN